MLPIFITGIGTGVGKTVVAAIVTEALRADYWKPVQAGFDDGTDSLKIGELISNADSVIHPEVYKLSLPASPHIAAREENLKIDLDLILEKLDHIKQNKKETDILVIEGAGGIMVPLNDKEFVIDLIQKLNSKVIIVSRNYLGSINHSLLTAAACKQRNIDVIGWIFNDQYLNYEDEIVKWSGFKKLGSVPPAKNINVGFLEEQAAKLSVSLKDAIMEFV